MPPRALPSCMALAAITAVVLEVVIAVRGTSLCILYFLLMQPAPTARKTRPKARAPATSLTCLRTANTAYSVSIGMWRRPPHNSGAFAQQSLLRRGTNFIMPRRTSTKTCLGPHLCYGGATSVPATLPTELICLSCFSNFAHCWCLPWFPAGKRKALHRYMFNQLSRQVPQCQGTIQVLYGRRFISVLHNGSW